MRKDGCLNVKRLAAIGRGCCLQSKLLLDSVDASLRISGMLPESSASVPDAPCDLPFSAAVTWMLLSFEDPYSGTSVQGPAQYHTQQYFQSICMRIETFNVHLEHVCKYVCRVATICTTLEQLELLHCQKHKCSHS